MRHIGSITGQNMGGVKAVYFTDQSNIISFPDVVGLRLVGDVILKENTFWYRLSPTVDTCEFKEPWKDEFDGGAYYPELKLTKANNKIDITEALWALVGRRLVFIILYNNGLSRLAGDQEYFLKLENESTSGASPRQRPDESITLKGESTHPAYFYTGSFNVEGFGTISLAPKRKGYLLLSQGSRFRLDGGSLLRLF